MKRSQAIIPLARLTGGQLRRSAQFAAALGRRDVGRTLAKVFGDHLQSAHTQFDESTSNFRIGQINAGTSENSLLEALSKKAANIYDAPHARICVTGSSGSIRQVVGHVLPRAAHEKKSIFLVDPACHKSVIGGLIESGLDVVFLSRKYSTKHGIFGPLDSVVFEAALQKFSGQVAATILTHPSYEGMDSELEHIKLLCDQHGSLLCIDSAWGSNYGLVDGLPPPPIRHADIVITSPHKKGLAPSQVSLVLFNHSSLVEIFDEASRAGCATTSPNWNLLLLFEHNLERVISGEWNERWQSALCAANEFRHRVSDIHPDFEAVTPKDVGALSGDPTHVYVDTSASGYAGHAIARSLSENFAIDVEMATTNGLLVLFGPAHQYLAATLVNRMRDALKTIRKVHCSTSCQHPIAQSASAIEPINPRSAYYSPARTIPFHRALGQVSASQLYVYPPGIPLLTYGQRVTEAHVAAINRLTEQGIVIAGLGRADQIKVTRAPPHLLTSSPAFFSDQTEIQMENESSEFTVTGYAFGKAPKEILLEVASLFREVFCNPPYNQFAASRAEPTKALSFADMAPPGYVAKEDYQPLEILDQTTLPPGAFRWMEPGEFEQRFVRKLGELYISTTRLENDQLAAFSIGRVLTVRDLFYSEEIRNPVYYSGREYISEVRDSRAFYDRMEMHFGLKPDDKLFFALGYGAHPSIRGKPFLVPMMNALAAHVLPEHADLPAIAEIPDDGAGRIFSQAVHERVVHGLLGTDHAMVYASTLQSVMYHYRKGSHHLMSLVKAHTRITRRELNPHPSDHPGVEIRQVGKKGNGVFATQAINPGELIAEFVGDVYTADLESELPSIMIDRCIQIGPKSYVFAENRLAEKINHSCEPNCGVREKTKIVAIKPIEEGDEITWDYRMSENSDWVLEDCKCGSGRCSGRIGGYDSLPEALRDEYLRKGAVSTWLLDRY